MHTSTFKDELGLSNVAQKMKKERRYLMVRRFLSNKLALTGSIIIILILLFTIIGPLITPHDPYDLHAKNRLLAPSSEYFWGTDNYGRDLLSRVAHGAKVSIGVGLSVSLITSILGMIIGLYAAYFHALDNILMRVCDGLMAFPAILLAIAIMAAMGPRIENVIIALSIVFTPYVARTVRSAALVVKEQTYIEALRSQGASSTRIIWSNMAPNVISPLVVQATFIFADSIITEAALSFLGAGTPAPAPSWGNLLYDGKMVIYNAWWMTVFPGVAIMLTVLGLNLFGDGLRDLLDPHHNKAGKS
ncbi:peptide/nickel transport system permease protein [Bacillus thermophilus]|uniref:Peptide/nickel transport system permease protein n=1 Tax=Siminovitchia thermophila TaxID=1245522 RepID=A0ABS2R4G5_9BACI|nr:ABC transporter permease [Siminovitchia thermophila]MBM7714064.1 peptide/nickel transport system permease protein [Siminovitchia thermophila]ONK21661.1 peptide ABC transporter permease [Bacillus sp. VT-16-64]